MSDVVGCGGLLFSVELFWSFVIGGGLVLSLCWFGCGLDTCVGIVLDGVVCI